MCLLRRRRPVALGWLHCCCPLLCTWGGPGGLSTWGFGDAHCRCTVLLLVAHCFRRSVDQSLSKLRVSGKSGQRIGQTQCGSGIPSLVFRIRPNRLSLKSVFFQMLNLLRRRLLEEDACAEVQAYSNESNEISRRSSFCSRQRGFTFVLPS